MTGSATFRQALEEGSQPPSLIFPSPYPLDLVYNTPMDDTSLCTKCYHYGSDHTFTKPRRSQDFVAVSCMRCGHGYVHVLNGLSGGCIGYEKGDRLTVRWFDDDGAPMFVWTVAE